MTDAAERERQRRFIGIALAAPFIIAPALIETVGGLLSAYALMAGLCATFALSWILAATVAATGQRAFAEIAAVGLLALAAAVILGAGGAGHPAALLACGIAFESWWIDRSRRRFAFGAATAAVAITASFALAPSLASQGPAASVWSWLAPALYLATIVVRFSRARDTESKSAPAHTIETVADMLGIPALRLTDSGEVIDASAKAGALFGIPSGLLAGRSIFERVHVADRVVVMNALSALKGDGSRCAAELRLRVAGNDDSAKAERFLPVAAEFVMADGALTMFVHDNSNLEGLRAELEEARQSVDSTEVAKNRFLAAVSHELRTPLNAIIGFSDMMLSDISGELTGRQREHVGVISEAGRHLLSVVNAILDVSKIESGAYAISPEPFQPNDAVELCRSMMAHQAESKGISMTVCTRPDVSELVADRRAVQQIMINLLSNAIKFTPEGGSVSLDVYRLGGTMSFVVADTGIGIAESDLGRLGRPFTQVDNDITRRFEGAGLGLSLVKGLVALHEGELAIESAPGDGTTVTVTLPVAGPGRREANGAAIERLMPHIEMGLKEEHETVRKTA